MARFNASKTHCKNGHEFTEDNTYRTPNGHRYCRTCKNVREKEYRTGIKTPDTYNCVQCGKEIPARSYKSKYCNKICSDEAHRKMARARLLLTLYGLSVEDFSRLREVQHEACAICKKPFIEGQQVAVDHDHITGVTRGLLCWRCNHKLLPAARDNADILRSAADYLESPPAVLLLGERIGTRAVLKSVRKKRRRRKPVVS